MKKAIFWALAITVLFGLSACMGTRGHVGNQRVCENEYLFGVLSLSELFSPCGK